MRHSMYYCAALVLLSMSPAAHSATFRFDTDPFAGTTALTTPGRQIVAGEQFLSFSPATDVFSLESLVFGAGSDVRFVNAAAADLPSGGVNIVVLNTFDDDNNPLTAFGAGQAANLIAEKITTPGAGFFVYFNQALNLPRLVFSTDLSSNTADLKVLARMTNLTGQTGRDAVGTFTAANFEITTDGQAPEPSTLFLMPSALVVCCFLVRRKLAR